MLAAAAKALAKSLLLSGLVAGLSALAWRADPILGALVGLVGSFLLMAGSYRREWRLFWVTILLPPLGSLACYLVQLGMLGAEPHPGFLLTAIAAGGLIGWLRGRTHVVFVKNERVYARRTTLYLVLWALCFIVSQLFGMARQRKLLDIALVGGGFTTAMLAGVAAVLLARYAAQRKKIGRGMAAMAAILLLAAAVPRLGDAQHGDAYYADIAERIIAPADLPGFHDDDPYTRDSARQFVTPSRTLLEVTVSEFSDIYRDDGYCIACPQPDSDSIRPLAVGEGGRSYRMSIRDLRIWYATFHVGAVNFKVTMQSENREYQDAQMQALVREVAVLIHRRYVNDETAPTAREPLPPATPPIFPSSRQSEAAAAVATAIMILIGMGVKVTNAVIESVVDSVVRDIDRSSLGPIPYDDEVRERLTRLVDGVKDPDLLQRVHVLIDQAETGQIDGKELARIEAIQEGRWSKDLVEITERENQRSREGLDGIRAKIAGEQGEAARREAAQQLWEIYHQRKEALMELMSRLRPEEVATIQAYLDRLDAKTALTVEDLDLLQQVHRQVLEKFAAANAGDAEFFQKQTDRGIAIGKTAVSVAGTLVEAPLGTGGAITSTIFGGAEVYDPTKLPHEQLGKIVGNAVISGLAAAGADKLQAMNPTGVVWGAGTGALVGAAEGAGKSLVNTGEIDAGQVLEDAAGGGVSGGLGGLLGKVTAGAEGPEPPRIEGTPDGPRVHFDEPDVPAPRQPFGSDAPAPPRSGSAQQASELISLNDDNVRRLQRQVENCTNPAQREDLLARLRAAEEMGDELRRRRARLLPAGVDVNGRTLGTNGPLGKSHPWEESSMGRSRYDHLTPWSDDPNSCVETCLRIIQNDVRQDLKGVTTPFRTPLPSGPLGGVAGPDIPRVADRLGLDAEPLLNLRGVGGNPIDKRALLAQRLQAGEQVILGVKFPGQQAHAVVVKGFDPGSGTFQVVDPNGGRRFSVTFEQMNAHADWGGTHVVRRRP